MVLLFIYLFISRLWRLSSPRQTKGTSRSPCCKLQCKNIGNMAPSLVRCGHGSGYKSPLTKVCKEKGKGDQLCIPSLLPPIQLRPGLLPHLSHPPRSESPRNLRNFFSRPGMVLLLGAGELRGDMIYKMDWLSARHEPTAPLAYVSCTSHPLTSGTAGIPRKGRSVQ